MPSNLSAGVLDLGIGNITTVVNALLSQDVLAEAVGLDQDFNFDPLIIPGVGHWSRAMEALEQASVRERLLQFYFDGGGLIGICLGMQILGQGSQEGDGQGLGLLPMEIVKLSTEELKPNVGWFQTYRTEDTNSQIGSESYYFLHSYGVKYDQQDWVESWYSPSPTQQIVSSVRSEKIGGFQFHPERSLKTGATTLAQMVREVSSK